MVVNFWRLIHNGFSIGIGDALAGPMRGDRLKRSMVGLLTNTVPNKPGRRTDWSQRLSMALTMTGSGPCQG